MGHPEWATDERFKDWERRQLHKQEIYPLIESYTKNYDKYELTKKTWRGWYPGRSSFRLA